MRTNKPTRFAQFGRLLRDARKARRITQADLATRLKVGQQAISSWERGTSRPETETLVLDLAAIFPEHDPAEWRESSGYRHKAAIRGRSTSKPTRPLLEALPLDQLSFQQFQGFSALVLEFLYSGKATVNQFGVEGDRQDGIDIEVRFANGRYETFQCKRERKFGPAKVREVIKNHKPKCARAVILLSRRATSEARKVLPASGKWGLWDSDDIAKKIRTLPLAKQKRVVDVYFPAYRRDFLGIDDIGALESPEAHFARFLGRDQVFSHAWTLVGREQELERLLALTDRAPQDLTLLVGSGGIGKSRLARGLADAYQKKYPDRSVLILAAGRLPATTDLEVAADQSTLILVEDAHEYSQVGQLLAILSRITPAVRLLVTTRPYAVQLVRSAALHNGYRIGDDSTVVLERLRLDKAESVAREILVDRKGPVQLARHIAQLTSGSSLALVVGSYLVATARINPRVLNNVPQFRDELFGRFRDAVTGNIGLESDRDAIRDVLNVVALLQPVDPEAPALARLAEQGIGLRIDQVRRAIELLYGAGVLNRRGKMYRIVPDLLAEYILEEVSVFKGSGKSSGYIERVMRLSDETQLANILVNVSKLDWRLSEGDEEQSRLADAVWNHMEMADERGLARRDTVIEAVAGAAYYQPGRALAFYDRVREAGRAAPKLADLLKYAAMSMDYVEEAAKRLWELGQGDTRRLNQYPSHPIRILNELAAIEPGKSVEYCQRVVRYAIHLIDTGQGGSGDLSAFGMLRAALATEGHVTESRGPSLVLSGFGVRAQAMAPVRQIIIDFLIQQLGGADLPRAVQAAAALGDALRYPHGIAGRVPTDRERASWSEEFVGTLRKIRSAIDGRNLDPFVTIELQRAVHWHAEYAKGVTRSEAHEVLAAIQQTLPYRISLALADGWGQLRTGRAGSIKDAMTEWHEEQKRVGSALVAALPSIPGALELLRERLRTLGTLGGERGSPGGFARMLVEAHPEVSTAICDAVVADPQDPLRTIFGEALYQFATAEPDRAMAVAKAALDLHDAGIARSVAWAYGVRLHSGAGIQPEESALAERLVQSEDDVTVMAIVRGIASQGATDRAWTLATLLSAPIDRSPGVADAVFTTFDSGALEFESLGAVTIGAFLEKLSTCPSIENHWIQEFLLKASRVSPGPVVDLLIGRIERDSGDAAGEFQAMPYLWDERSGLMIRESGELGKLLKRVREWLLTAPENVATVFWGPKLYAAVASGYDQAVLDDLDAWTKSGDAARLEVVGRVLQAAPQGFVFDQRPFVVALLDRAAAVSDDCVRKLRSYLWGSAVSGMWEGTPGKPAPQYEERRDRSVEALAHISRSSPARALFEALRRDAQADIRWKDQRDEEIFDE